MKHGINKEASYRALIEKVRNSTSGRGGVNTGTRIAEIFEVYPHNYDLSRNPLTSPGRRLLQRNPVA